MVQAKKIENNLISIYVSGSSNEKYTDHDGFEILSMNKSTEFHEIKVKIICALDLNKNTESIISSHINEINGLILMFNTKDSKSFEDIKKFVEVNKDKLKASLSWLSIGIIEHENDYDENNCYVKTSFFRQYDMNMHEQNILDK